VTLNTTIKDKVRDLKNGLDVVEGTTTAVTIFDDHTLKRYECHRYIVDLADHYYCACCGGFVR